MIGLDIGAYSIKAIELQKKDTISTLTGFKMLERSREEPLQVSLRKVLEGANFKSRDVGISLAGTFVSFRVIELPEMGDGELKGAAKFEIERFMPFTADTAVTDYQVIMKNAATKKNIVLLAAAKADLVKNYIDIISQIGFTVRLVDVSASALTNAFLSAYPAREKDSEENAFVVLNVGDTLSTMSVVHKASPLVLRDIGIAGREISEAIAKSLDVDIKEAYRMKHNPPADKKTEVTETIRPVLDKLCREIRLSLGYFENQFSKGVARIYLSGGSSRLFGLKESLSESLEIQVEPWNPFNSVAIGEGLSVKSLDEAKEDLAIALGLAIRDD